MFLHSTLNPLPSTLPLNGAQYRDRTCDLSHVKGTRYRCANWADCQEYYSN